MKFTIKKKWLSTRVKMLWRYVTFLVAFLSGIFQTAFVEERDIPCHLHFGIGAAGLGVIIPELVRLKGNTILNIY